MRKAMICVSVMLALLQFWPMVFGQRTVAQVATPAARAAIVVDVPKRIAAVSVTPKPEILAVSASKPALPQNCFARYKATLAACTKGDLACNTAANTQWDLCEATGFWPE